MSSENPPSCPGQDSEVNPSLTGPTALPRTDSVPAPCTPPQPPAPNYGFSAPSLTMSSVASKPLLTLTSYISQKKPDTTRFRISILHRILCHQTLTGRPQAGTGLLHGRLRVFSGSYFCCSSGAFSACLRGNGLPWSEEIPPPNHQTSTVQTAIWARQKCPTISMLGWSWTQEGGELRLRSERQGWVQKAGQPTLIWST